MFRAIDTNEKENQFQQLLNSMNIKSLCEMSSEDQININNNMEFFDSEYPLN